MPPHEKVECPIGLDPIRMGVLFEKLDNMHYDICGKGGLKQLVGLQNSRISKLEKFKIKVLAWVAGGGGVTTFVINHETILEFFK